ncbi:MAG: hypothetical protein Q8P24_14125 [Desulfobacterales bacterium]|nr:hypothetical protein [Desulfobacterales bacterium]
MNKKQNIVQKPALLFAHQCFDCTKTLSRQSSLCKLLLGCEDFPAWQEAQITVVTYEHFDMFFL